MKTLKYILQFLVIMLFFYSGNFIPEILKPMILIPGSIIGMLLLFLSLSLKIVKLEHLEDTSNFFLKYMGFFFVPLGVSLMDSFDLLKDIWWQLTLVLLISNIFVMGFSAKITETLIVRNGGEKK